MLKFLKIFFISILSVLLLAVALLYITGNDYLIKGVRLTYLRGHNTASIDDYQFFDTRKLQASNPQAWGASADGYQPSTELMDWHKEYKSVAYLVIQNDSIRYENYWDDYHAKSLSNSFSMAKTYASVLLLMAIEDGYVTGMDQPVGDFIEEYKTGDNAQVQMGHLIRMNSGLDWIEHYTSPFSITAQSYYGDDLEGIARGLKVIKKPGQSYEYLSGNAAVLALALKEAVGMPLADYASKKLWGPLGAEVNAEWVLDKEDGLEKAYCCLASNARDFARLGKLFLDKGNWKGEQLIDSSWVEISSSPDQVDFYSHGWWVYNENNKQAFYMRGILGQYVIVLPELDVVVVRLGKIRGPVVNNHPLEVSQFVYEMYQQYGQ